MARNFNFVSNENPVLSTSQILMKSAEYPMRSVTSAAGKKPLKIRRSTGKLKHRRFGYIQVYALDTAYHHLNSSSMSDLQQKGKIKVSHYYKFDDEVFLESSIPSEYVLGYQIFSLPSFNCEWSKDLQRCYGLSQKTYNNLRQQFLSPEFDINSFDLATVLISIIQHQARLIQARLLTIKGLSILPYIEMDLPNISIAASILDSKIEVSAISSCDSDASEALPSTFQPLGVQLFNGVDAWEVDVYADGNCLFYSVVLAYLLPEAENEESFTEKFLRLFGKENLANSEALRLACLEYKGEAEWALKHLSALVNSPEGLRCRIADLLMEEEIGKEVIKQIQTEQDEQDLEKIRENFKKSGSYAGHSEITLLSLLLGKPIRSYSGEIITFIDSQGIREDSNPEQESLHVKYVALISGKKENHWHCLLPKAELSESLNAVLEEAGKILTSLLEEDGYDASDEEDPNLNSSRVSQLGLMAPKGEFSGAQPNKNLMPK